MGVPAPVLPAQKTQVQVAQALVSAKAEAVAGQVSALPWGHLTAGQKT